jgi:putative FmdB family regulatory protein
MPTYDYRCKGCGHAFEHFQSMKDAVLRTCPACKKKSLERLIGTGAALIFKGAGFYQTDYRSESFKAAEKADKPAESTPAETSAGKAGSQASQPSPAAATGGSNGASDAGGGSANQGEAARGSARRSSGGANKAASTSKPSARAAKQSATKGGSKAVGKKRK